MHTPIPRFRLKAGRFVSSVLAIGACVLVWPHAESRAAQITISSSARTTFQGWGLYPDHFNESKADDNTVTRPWIQKAVYDLSPSFIRVELSGGYYRSGTTVGDITFNTSDSNSPGSWQQDRFDFLVHALQDARKHGVSEYILASWSPPDSMKSLDDPANTATVPSLEPGSSIRHGKATTLDHVVHRTRLRADKEQLFCNWYVAAIKYLESQGVGKPLNISIQNEPTMWNINYQGCYMDAVQWRRVVKLMRATLDANGCSDVIILGHDDTFLATVTSDSSNPSNNPGYFEGNFPVLNPSNTAKYDLALDDAIGGYAFHTYDVGNQGSTVWGVYFCPRPVWMTEWNNYNYENGDGGGTADIDYAIKTARHISSDFTTLRTSYWTWFNAWYKASNTIIPGELVGGDQSALLGKSYYIIRRLWQTVRPGWKSYSISSDDPDLNSGTDIYNAFKDTTVSGIAYANAAGTESVLLIANPSSTAKSNVIVNGLKGSQYTAFTTTASSSDTNTAFGTLSQGQATLQLPARSVTIVQSAPQVNFLLNGGFDNAGMATALPANWSTWSSGGFEAASYTESSDSTAPFRLSHYRSSSYNVQTYQKLNGLLAGSYTLTARVKSSGGQPTCQMELKVPGQPNHTVGIPVTSTWTQVTIPNISITGGTCQVGFYSWAYSSQWMTVDDVKLTRQ
jgi:hypothetical protein